MMTELQKIKQKYPDCYYDQDIDAIMTDDETIIADDARELIEDHFDGEKMNCMTSSGNPEDMIYETVTGKEFIDGYFGGDYHHAFDNI